MASSAPQPPPPPEVSSIWWKPVSSWTGGCPTRRYGKGYHTAVPLGFFARSMGSRRVALRYVTLRYVTLRYVTLRSVTFRFFFEEMFWRLDVVSCRGCMCVYVFFPPLGVSIFPEVFLVCLWGGRFFEVFFCCLVCTYVCTYDIGEVFFNCWVSYRGCRGFFGRVYLPSFCFLSLLCCVSRCCCRCCYCCWTSTRFDFGRVYPQRHTSKKKKRHATFYMLGPRQGAH